MTQGKVPDNHYASYHCQYLPGSPGRTGRVSPLPMGRLRLLETTCPEDPQQGSGWDIVPLAPSLCHTPWFGSSTQKQQNIGFNPPLATKVLPSAGFNLLMCITGLLSRVSDHPSLPGTWEFLGQGTLGSCLGQIRVTWSPHCTHEDEKKLLSASSYVRVIPGTELKWKVPVGVNSSG